MNLRSKNFTRLTYEAIRLGSTYRGAEKAVNSKGSIFGLVSKSVENYFGQPLRTIFLYSEQYPHKANGFETVNEDSEPRPLIEIILLDLNDTEAVDRTYTVRPGGEVCCNLFTPVIEDDTWVDSSPIGIPKSLNDGEIGSLALELAALKSLDG